MALTRVGRHTIFAALIAVGASVGALPCRAQAVADQTTQAKPLPQNSTRTVAAPFEPAAIDAQPDVWIFSGALQSSHEMFSGTLVAGKGDAQFELKLAGGATCDGSQVASDAGLVRLSEITCTDDRTMRALFVPQGGTEFKVFGHVGDERFTAIAHLLGTEPIPDKAQTTAPTTPGLQSRPGGAAPKPTDVPTNEPGSSR